jgi:hypothetical protein
VGIACSYVARAIERGETRGLMKIVINADSPYTLFENAMFIHPTLTEGFFALMGNVEAR